MTASVGTNESFKDLKLSYVLFIQNFRAFIATELFAISAFVITIACGLIFIASISLIFPASLTLETIVTVFVFMVILGFNFLFYGFLSCQYGLSYDIMRSGDLFTEFKKSFSYFRRFWWQYSLVTFLIFFPTIFSPINTAFSNTIQFQGIEYLIGSITPLKVLIYFMVEYIWFVTFVELYPSITSHGSLLQGFKENFTILRRKMMRILTSIGLYYMIFKIPIIMMYIVSLLIPNNQNLNVIGMINFLNSLYILVSSLLGPPILSLIATRIYVSLKQ